MRLGRVPTRTIESPRPLHHRRRWVDADDAVAGGDQDGGGAALAEPDLEDRAAGCGEVEEFKCPVVGVGGVFHHGATEDAADESGRVPGLAGPEPRDNSRACLDVGGGHRAGPARRWRIMMPQAVAESSG
jgi:hypothetical protein